MTVLFEDEAEVSFDFDMEEQLQRTIACVSEYVQCPYDIEVSVTFVDKEAIRQMNGEFRQIDKVTDVLSFPMMEYDTPCDFEGSAFKNSRSISPDTKELVLGDIVLCSEVVKEQAKEYEHSDLREFCFLVVHSMLHLFGYDHIEENDRIQMEEEQRHLMDLLGISR